MNALSRLVIIMTLVFGMLGSVGQPAAAQAANARKLIVSGSYRLVDKDGGWSGDDVRRGKFNNEYVVDSTRPTDMYLNECSDEVRGELDLHAILEANGVIRVLGAVRYYEGTNCTTNQVHRSQDVNITIQPGKRVARSFYLSDSEGNISFTVYFTNAR